mmetsp:Transcript_57523/g.125114  ORF Transcript_57523/g.125114 Transcript_57523/m.125114 type:complete len:98 (+) Transcript_57523:33-326(+)
MSGPQPVADSKGEARDVRLKYIRKTEQEVIRMRLIEEAKVSCKEKFRDFAECSQASGLLVVLRCRRENRAISDCIDSHYNEDVFQKYLRDHGLRSEL